MTDSRTALRLIEALLFAASEPLDEETIAARLPEEADVAALLAELRAEYAERGVNLVRVAGKWALRTAEDLAPYLSRHVEVQRKLSRAAVETLAIIAYHQPVTRAEIEEIRGVGISRGTLDILMEAGWVRPKGRRRTPGRPATWVTTEGFLEQFGLETLDDLPGVGELRAAGLLDSGRTSLSMTVEGGDGDADDDRDDADDGADDEDDTGIAPMIDDPAQAAPEPAAPESAAPASAAGDPASREAAAMDGRAPGPPDRNA